MGTARASGIINCIGEIMLTQERLKELINYDPENGNFTRIKNLSSRAMAGSICGSHDKDGYLQIMIDYKKYKLHRLAWLYVNGIFPANCVDHINGVKDDNRYVNLRSATYQQNNRNRVKSSNNTSGLVGVYWHKLANKWCAQSKVDKNVIYLGLFENKEDASNAYQVFIKANFGDFYRNTTKGALSCV